MSALLSSFTAVDWLRRGSCHDGCKLITLMTPRGGSKRGLQCLNGGLKRLSCQSFLVSRTHSSFLLITSTYSLLSLFTALERKDADSRGKCRTAHAERWSYMHLTLLPEKPQPDRNTPLSRYIKTLFIMLLVTQCLDGRNEWFSNFLHMKKISKHSLGLCSSSSMCHCS